MYLCHSVTNEHVRGEVTITKSLQGHAVSALGPVGGGAVSLADASTPWIVQCSTVQSLQGHFMQCGTDVSITTELQR